MFNKYVLINLHGQIDVTHVIKTFTIFIALEVIGL